MKTFVRLALAMVFAITATPLAAPRQAAPAAPARNGVALERELPKPNYELASRWTSAKVGKSCSRRRSRRTGSSSAIASGTTTKRRRGMKWWVVDPVKKTKAPMFDNAKMAAQLTRMLRTPYDAQHLPIIDDQFIKNDTKIRFSVSLPRESKVEDATGERARRHDADRAGATGAGRPRRRPRWREAADSRCSRAADAAPALKAAARRTPSGGGSSTTSRPARWCSTRSTSRSAPPRTGRRCPPTSRRSSSRAASTCS